MMDENEDALEEASGHELDNGVQPLDAILTELGVTSHELVEKCGEGLTHKAMTRARKGRRLTPKMKRPWERWSNIAACWAISTGCMCERLLVPSLASAKRAEGAVSLNSPMSSARGSKRTRS